MNYFERLIQDRMYRNRNTIKRAWIWILPVLVAVGIFFFSSQPGEDSSQLSNGLIQSFLEMISRVKFFQSRDVEEWITILSTPVRKGAHITEYILLYLTLVLAMYVTGRRRPRWLFLAMLITFCYACSDEFHQIFVPGRAGRFTDVLIDCSGGMVIFLLLLWKKRKNGKKRCFSEKK